jgi:Mg2+/Co2+ transporter CorC
VRAEHGVHSPLPLIEDRDPERVLGVVHGRAMFDKLIGDDTKGTRRDLMRPALLKHEPTAGHQWVEQFLGQHQHLAGDGDKPT